MRIIISAMIVFSFIACKQPKEKVQNSATEQRDAVNKMPEAAKVPAVAISALASPEDPECGMKITEKEYGDTALINGKIYGFCGTGCKEEYLKKQQGKK